MDAKMGWAVLGKGRAGMIRARDIDQCPGQQLSFYVGGREGADALRAAVASPEVDAIAICLANDGHAKWAQVALDLGKHVLVEFPLCASERQARTLYALASARGRQLHVEFIGLLTAAHAGRRTAVSGGQVARVEVDFQGGLYRWVRREAEAGRVGQLAIGRLQALDDLCGRLRVARPRCRSFEEGYELTVELTSASGVDIRLRERRAPGLARGVQWRLLNHDGEEVAAAPAEVPAGGLFWRDLQAFIADVEGPGRGGYVSPVAVIAVQRVADIITAEAHWRLSSEPSC